MKVTYRNSDTTTIEIETSEEIAVTLTESYRKEDNSTLPMGVLFSTASTSGEAAQSGRKSSAGTFMNPPKASTPRNAGRR